MLLDALATIGDQIASEEYENRYVSICDPEPISGSKAIETVVTLTFTETDDGLLEYNGIQITDPPGTPLETALQYGYVNRYNQFDYSLSQRATSSIATEWTRMRDWPTDDSLGDHRENTLIKALADAFNDFEDQISSDVSQYDEEVEYNALLTIIIDRDGNRQYPGEEEVFSKATFEAYSEGLETASSATESSGTACCSVCDTETTTYGLGASLDKMYTVKKQWPFPEYNSSLAWQSRPLCGDCILNIEIAVGLFIGEQDYGAPNIQCRLIPYTLPMAGSEDRLRSLISSSRDTLTKGNKKRPLKAAWEHYRFEANVLGEDDVLRLAFVHYIKDSAKAHGVAWIDGVSVDQLDTIQTRLDEISETTTVFAHSLLPTPHSPTEKQIFTGMWLFNLLSEYSDSDNDQDNIGDDNQWADFTEKLLTKSPIAYEHVIDTILNETEDRSRRLRHGEILYSGSDTDDSDNNQSDSTGDDDGYDSVYDRYHLAQSYAFIRFCANTGLLTDTRTTHTMNPDEFTGEFTSFGDGLAEFINAHSSIAQSPGRRAAFVLGAVAAQLSNWQIERGLNRTFIQNRDSSQLTIKRLTEWQTDVWEKAKTYNAQNGNYGIPWADAEELFHDAVLKGEEDNWNATTSEIRYHYILGVNTGPRIANIARENTDADDPEQTDEHLADAPLAEDD